MCTWNPLMTWKDLEIWRGPRLKIESTFTASRYIHFCIGFFYIFFYGIPFFWGEFFPPQFWESFWGFFGLMIVSLDLPKQMPGIRYSWREIQRHLIYIYIYIYIWIDLNKTFRSRILIEGIFFLRFCQFLKPDFGSMVLCCWYDTAFRKKLRSFWTCKRLDGSVSLLLIQLQGWTIFIYTGILGISCFFFLALFDFEIYTLDLQWVYTPVTVYTPEN